MSLEPEANAGGRRRRSRRGGGRAETVAPTGLRQPDWRSLTNPYAPVEVISADQVEMIHDASLRVLEEIGMDFLLPIADRLVCLEAGRVLAAGLTGDVRGDPAVIASYLGTEAAQ